MNTETKEIELSICIVNWNVKELLRKCLNSIYQKTEGILFEVIVVDNGSTDGSVEMLKREFPECKIVASNENLGFSKGNNLAIKHARGGKYIAFLNPDTELKTQALVGMTRFLEGNPKYGAVGCKLLNMDGTIQFACARKFPTPFTEFCFLSLLERAFPRSKFFSGTEMRYWNHRTSRDVACLSGACIVARRKTIDKIGGFNEKYFMYAEDIDLCYRIRRNGWPIYYLAEEEIYHFGGASSGQRSEKSFTAIMVRESNHKFLKNNYGSWTAIEYRSVVFAGSIIRLMVICLLSPSRLISNKYQKEISSYSLIKYFHLFLWAIKVKIP